MGPIIDGIDISKKFTSAEIFELHDNGKLRAITLHGYVTRVDILDDTISFEPFWKSSKFRDETGTMKLDEFTVESKRKELEHEHPISRTSPQEKVARMALRLLAAKTQVGTVPGLTDEEVADLVGESWKAGDPLSGEDLRKMAQTLMSRAEVDNREADSHRVTRDFMTA